MRTNPLDEPGSLLSKYDEAPARASITLDQSGSVNQVKLKRLAEIKQRLAVSAVGGVLIAHNIDGVQQARTLADGSDFQSPAEVEATAFRRSTRSEGKAKRMRKKFKRDSNGLDFDTMAAEEAAKGVTDRGSAATRVTQVERKDEAALALTAAKRDRFAHAINDSTARTAELIGGGASPPGLEVHESAEIDAELYAVLARAQRLAQVSAGQSCTHDHAAMAIASQLAAMDGGRGGIQDGTCGVRVHRIHRTAYSHISTRVKALEALWHTEHRTRGAYTVRVPITIERGPHQTIYTVERGPPRSELVS